MLPSSLVFLMSILISNNVWEVYGVDVASDGVCITCSELAPVPTQPSAISLQSPVSVASYPSPPLAAAYPTASSLTTRTIRDDPTVGISSASTLSSALPASGVPKSQAPAAKLIDGLSTGAKAGIGLALGILGFALVSIIVYDARFFKKKRRERAMMNAVQEVESAGSMRQNDERVVLESRVSIVIEDPNEDDPEVGRNGLSLPRRAA
ncbi:hypothetical protein B0J11DRAFT_583481 [Dendryphion nanum]|uniref:Uncharacterized protein n=1 Tax=Dendryphion nanum TaxID=256645 RepID=A0A9P9DCS7_9PLEO|nr:hypothetical protein B0J11DRAFT_583481 [Dendryphion nanum]